MPDSFLKSLVTLKMFALASLVQQFAEFARLSSYLLQDTIYRPWEVLYRVIKKMSPLAFKSNKHTTDALFHNSLSNECIHTRFPFQIALSEACKPKVVDFLRVQISSNGKMCFVVPVSHLKVVCSLALTIWSY